ncbi:uncharacterized protein GGS22DRAFT_149129 [Annulohypoxylon maeteangense]|uniref:uncharacterized protein n=1 Tax=Annulohypoxylon maeteangense TaxID=1927788 RepID=UPI002008D968|nr:uncharacterized protein GGS22DRAFT_149129 [Annulohypoxylon maeteangense]KAI0889772.1 hypothetical protein GGS22DRAFT_149129 [Annulohypoxylon maeteangense]
MSDAESDDAKRALKKRKASRACDRCNSQHQPCDNATPKCSVCVRAGTECTYNRPVRKRGPRSGYTGQNGERLWAIILQARPELEDIVLQVLRGGTYGNTGVPNLDYFRNNDNQAELVNCFNESRLGRFLQNGESPDLLLPPINQQVSPMIAQVRSDMGFGQSANAHRQQDVTKSMSGQSNRSASISQSCPVNPHGAPQDPGDIYIQSEDIRRRVFHNQTQMNNYFLGLPEDLVPDISANHTPSNLTAAQGTTPFSNNSIDGYGASTQTNDRSVLDRRMSVDPSVNISEPSRPSESNNPSNTSFENPEYHLDETSRWLDSTPFDTLRNLGFAPGERMAEDFLELCENPDPIDHTPATSADQDEDEEAVWRRLVMRGRFI